MRGLPLGVNSGTKESVTCGTWPSGPGQAASTSRRKTQRRRMKDNGGERNVSQRTKQGRNCGEATPKKSATGVPRLLKNPRPNQTTFAEKTGMGRKTFWRWGKNVNLLQTSSIGNRLEWSQGAGKEVQPAGRTGWPPVES